MQEKDDIRQLWDEGKRLKAMECPNRGLWIEGSLDNIWRGWSRGQVLDEFLASRLAQLFPVVRTSTLLYPIIQSKLSLSIRSVISDNRDSFNIV